jgi:hypothetical protein
MRMIAAAAAGEEKVAATKKEPSSFASSVPLLSVRQMVSPAASHSMT